MQQRQSQLLSAQHSKSSIKRWSVVWPSNSSCLLIHKQDVIENKDPYDYTTRKKKQKRSHHKRNTAILMGAEMTYKRMESDPIPSYIIASHYNR